MGGGGVDPSRAPRLSGAAPTEPRASASSSSPRASASGHAPSRSTHPPYKPPPARATLEIRNAEPSSLAAELRAALGAPGLATLTVDLDTAEYLDDEVAPVLKRAVAAAESAGIEIVLRATRPGTSRWLRRNGLAGGEK